MIVLADRGHMRLFRGVIGVASPTDFQKVFTQLRAILKRLERKLEVQTDTKGKYYLNTKVLGKNKQPICFGSVAIKKNYVSYYLMSVYACPKLLDGMSPELKARMQGKACFNFKADDPKLFKELARLTEEGLGPYLQMLDRMSKKKDERP